MINHLRNLLMNVPGRSVSVIDVDYPGEELVDPNYRVVRLPAAVERTRTLLFGPDPDRAMLNWRVRQLLQIVHATELEHRVSEYDPRITYVPFDNHSLYDQQFGITETYSNTNNFGTLYIGGDASTTGNRLYQTWRLAVIGDSLRINRDSAPLLETLVPLNTTEGLSADITLPDTNLTINIGNPTNGDAWSLTSFLKPVESLAVAIARVETSGDLTALFGTPAEAEPMRTYRSLWYGRKEFPYMVAALTLAMGHRTEAARVK